MNWDLLEMESSAGEDSHWGDREVALNYNSKTWTSIHKFIRRPWFKRLWVWQEVILAKTAEMRCGHETLDWNSFRKATFCIHQQETVEYKVDLETWGDFLDVLDYIYEFIVKSANLGFLWHLLEDTKGCECIDPRDRIYALLNLSHKTPALVGLQPDYTQEPRDIYQDVVLRHLTYEGDLNLLTHCEWHGGIVNKPTWVPDWSKPRASRRIQFKRGCLGSRAKADIVRNGVLRVTGLYCAEINDIGRNTLHDETLFSPGDPDVVRQIKSLAKYVKVSVPYVDGSDVIEAFCRTVCANFFSDVFNPAVSGFPDLGESLRYLRCLLRAPSSQIEPDRMFLSYAREVLKGRRFFTTKEGYIGLAPEAVQMGDQVCIILGCQSPLLLRREEKDRYLVIGECYIHGLMNGEALLGSLSLEWQYASIHDGEVRRLFHGFVNVETRSQAFEDPRLGQLPPGWRLEDQEYRADWNNWVVNEETGERLDWPYDPRMTAEALRARGVPLREFLLE